MAVSLNIEYEQLVEAIKSLPPEQLRKLKIEIDKETKKQSTQTDLETLLLNGPVATKKQLEVIKSNRRYINQWRTK